MRFILSQKLKIIAAGIIFLCCYYIQRIVKYCVYQDKWLQPGIYSCDILTRIIKMCVRRGGRLEK